jgi:glycosyltransferase involved in cell wall biosynthesis
VPKALASHLMLPVGYGPRRYAIPALDRFLRFNPRSPLAKSVYRRVVSLAHSLPATEDTVTVTRSIVLKAADEKTGERGLLLTSFESELSKLARLHRLPQLVASYDVAFLPTWQPFYSIPLYQYVARSGRRLLLMPSSGADYELCRARHDDLIALPFQASSWVNPDLYRPPPPKDIDIIMVANFSAYKRHWHLFRAVRDLPSGWRVVLVGVPIGDRTRAARFEIHEAPPNDVLASLLARARVCVALSAKEGSYIAIAEALFSGTPVGVYRDAVIGSKDYINDQTGMLFDSGLPLAPQIERFVARADSYAPQEWATTNISSKVNGRRLNDLLRSNAVKGGEPWSCDVAAFYCRHFDFYYEAPADERKFAPVYDRLRGEFGVAVARPDSAA